MRWRERMKRRIRVKRWSLSTIRRTACVQGLLSFDEYETIGKKSELMSSMFLSLILFIGFILYSLLMLQLLFSSFVSDFLATS
jgi:hypothetical protein